MFRGTYQRKEKLILLLVFLVPPTVIPWDWLSLQWSQKAGVDAQASCGLSQTYSVRAVGVRLGLQSQGRASVASTVNGSNC